MLRTIFFAGTVAVITTLAGAVASAAAPIQLHPKNPHYMLWNGKPTVLITSGEHYGAVLNEDFDYATYLKTLHQNGLNLTRLWAGTYREVPGSFNIADNTLAPEPERYLAPWARSEKPGYVGGGNLFDLTRWDDKFYKRLHDFMDIAKKQGVVVELALFCTLYDDTLWHYNPMNAQSNINGIGTMPREDVYTLKHPELLKVQDTFVRKVVTELNRYDNLYYEICNEPYFAGVSLEWQAHIADIIAETEKKLPARHMISQNIQNEGSHIDSPNPLVSIFNFHYAVPEKSVYENYAINKVIACNETGFNGTSDQVYRRQAWSFMLAGGAVFNNLDYSFTAKHPDGTFAYPDTQPGGGTVTYRKQLGILANFMRALPYISMKPSADLLKAEHPDNARAYLLAKVYALYQHGAEKLDARITAPDGKYKVTRWNVLSGVKTDMGETAVQDGALHLIADAPGGEIAVVCIRK